MKVIMSFIFLLLFLTSCVNESEELLSDTGTVKYISLEGGFYGIISDKSINYDPISIPAQYKTDGLRIVFKYKIAKEQVSYHMWGTIIELISINKIN